MNERLQSDVVPVLRKMGFTGSLPHFRRRTESRIDLLSFQFDKYGGGFVVEIAKCGPRGTTMPWGEVIPPSKVSAQHINEPRPRLKPAHVEGDYWFRFDKGRTPDDAVQELLPLLSEVAERWWSAT